MNRFPEVAETRASSRPEKPASDDRKKMAWLAVIAALAVLAGAALASFTDGSPDQPVRGNPGSAAERNDVSLVVWHLIDSSRRG